MIEVSIPNNFPNERTYIIDIVFGEFLGVDYHTRLEERLDYSISFEGRNIDLPDLFFPGASQAWLQPASLPRLPLMEWDMAGSGLDACLVSPRVPLLFGSPRMEMSEVEICLGLDIFGSVFFLLSCYEEAVKPDRDKHDRFPVSASIAHQGGFIDRPLVNEYVEILWAAMKRLWPNLSRKKRTFKSFVSCDVDQPYSTYIKSVPLTVKKIAGDIIKRKCFGMAINSGLNAIASRVGNFSYEPNHTFEWIMDVNEAAGNSVMFNFIAGCTVPEMEGLYFIDEQRIRKLMRRIHERGHEIGLHGSYGTYKSAELYGLEAKHLRKIMAEEGISQNEIGNRQHYLRWSMTGTARNLEQNGISYDTTLGYADQPGFRCGTCYEYPMYDLTERKALQLRQKPLVVMECSILDECYMGMGPTDESLELMLTFKSRVKIFDGDFTLLWHNSYFMSGNEKEIYRTVIS